MTIVLTAETEARLHERARRDGQDAAALADALLADALTNDPDDLPEELLLEIRAGIDRGLQAAAAGRVVPLAQAVAETRRRHGFDAAWAAVL